MKCSRCIAGCYWCDPCPGNHRSQRGHCDFCNDPQPPDPTRPRPTLGTLLTTRVPDSKLTYEPEWVKRAREHRLVVKDYSND